MPPENRSLKINAVLWVKEQLVFKEVYTDPDYLNEKEVLYYYVRTTQKNVR